MRHRRIYAVGAVLGVTLAAAVWLLTYRVWQVIEYIGPGHRAFHEPDHVRLQPWWSVPATVLILLAGIDTSLRLLPSRRGLLRRLADYLSGTSRDSIQVRNTDSS